MRYALTFTTDANDSWGTTDTIIFETDSDKTKDELEDLVYDILKAYRVEGAEIIATSGWWFLRNCEDTDVKVEKETVWASFQRAGHKIKVKKGIDL